MNDRRRPTRGGRVTLALASVLVAGVAGCGKSSPAAPSPQPPPVVVTPPAPEPPADPHDQPPAPAPPKPTLAVSKILAFGDSLTEGVVSAAAAALPFWSFVEVPQSYPYKLRAQLAERYAAQTFAVFNGGLAGEWADDAPPRFADAVKQSAPEVVLLMDGANDLLNLRRRGISPAIGGIETMIREAKRRGAQVFLATLPPVRAGAPKGDAAPYIAEFNAQIVKTAAEEGATVVDVFAAIPLSEVGADGLHLTEAGYTHLAAVFLDALARAYERPGAAAAHQ